MRARMLCLLLVVFLLLNLPAYGQVDYSTATLKGTVLDPQEFLVTGAKVTVKNPSTGFNIVVQTAADGTYRVPLLPPGTYNVQVQATGFASVVGMVSLNVGQIVNYDVHLKVGAMTESVEVAESAPLVAVEQTQQANTITVRQVEDLPNVTRSFTDSVFTLPGVAKSEAPRSQNPGFSGFQSSGFSIGGSNGRNNLVTIDGGENDYGSGQLRTPHVPVDAIQEFQVNRSSFTAEFGFTAGTAVNIVTKGGSNDLHGNVYAYFRNRNTDAMNYFAPSTGERAFEQNFVPGFTVGGPLVKNKLFFFTAFEYVKGDTPQFRSYSTSAAAQIKPTQVTYLTAMAQTPGLGQVAGALTQLLTPAATTPGTPAYALLAPNTGAFNDWKKFHNLDTRVDYQRGTSDTITGRFSFMQDNSSRMYILDPLNSPDDATFQYWRDYTVLGTWNHIFNPNLVNQVRMQFSRNTADVPVAAPNTAYLRIGGLGQFGGEHYEPYWARQHRFQFEDSLSWTKGKHTLKFGASLRPISYNIHDELWFGGEFQFYDGVIPIDLVLMQLVAKQILPPEVIPAVKGFTAAYTAAHPDFRLTDTNLTALQTYDLGVPIAYRQGFGNPNWKDWAFYVGSFAQDSWKISRSFSLDFGGRVDFDGEASPIPHHTYFSPRLGFAWSPGDGQKTVVRGGGGIFVAPVPFYIGYIMNLLNEDGRHINQVATTLTTSNCLRPFVVSPQQTYCMDPLAVWQALLTKAGQQPPPYQKLSAAEVQQVLNISQIGPGQPNRVIVELMPGYKNNYAVQASLSVQRQLGSNMALEIAYQMYHGVHMDMPVDTNVEEIPGLIDPFIGPFYSQIDPMLAQRETYSSIGSSIYHGMTASLTRRFAKGLQFQVNYTFSKTIDDNTDFNNDFMPFRPTRLALERGISSFNIKHNFVGSAVYQTPFKAGSGIGRILADMTLSPVVSLRSGIPFTLRVPGMQNGTQGESLWARPWNAGRNTGIGPNFYSLDMRVNKSFYLNRERGIKFDFLVEGTNIFNHPNFSAVNDFFPVDATLPLGSGTLLDGPYNVRGTKSIDANSPLGFKAAFEPRQVQFGVKFIF